MVQIRPPPEKPPSTGGAVKFWGGLKHRLRRRKQQQQQIKETCSDAGCSCRETESEDVRNADLFELRRMGRRLTRRILGFAHKWGLTGTFRWLRVARVKFRLKGDVRVNRAVNRRKAEKKAPEENAARDLNQQNSYTDRRWEPQIQVGKVKIATWMNGKGTRSIRAPLILRDSDDEEEEKAAASEIKEESILGEGCCGCIGGRMLWPRQKCWKNILEIGRLERQQDVKPVANLDDQPALPDDIIEMCLARTPFTSLIKARAVCKKWKFLTLSPHFLQLRESMHSWEPWLFLFGLSRDGVCLGQIQALDPASSRWYTIKADILTGRLSYSVTAINSVIYVVGGCSSSSLSGSGRTDKESLKTLKTVLMYTPLTGSWRQVSSLTTERAAPILGVFKLQSKTYGGERTYGDAGRPAGRVHLSWPSDLYPGRSPARRRSRRRGELAVYGEEEDQGREVDALGNDDKSVKDAFANLNNQQEGSAEVLVPGFKEFDVQGTNQAAKQHRKFGIIVVGGQGTWNEQLDSAEIYDPVTDNWREIASLPGDHGTPCAGVVCKNFFYVYSESNKLAAFDLEHEVWHSIRVSQAPARLLDFTPKLVSCRNRVFLLGVAWGMIAEDGSDMATRKIWELHQEPASTGWVKVSQHPDAPLDWNAVFVADEEKIFGVEMFKIFGQMLDFVTVCKISAAGSMVWERVSRMEMATHEMDPSSCLTKTAIVVQL